MTEHFGFGGLTGGFKAVQQGKNKLGLVIGSLVFLVWVAENQAGYEELYDYDAALLLMTLQDFCHNGVNVDIPEG